MISEVVTQEPTSNTTTQFIKNVVTDENASPEEGNIGFCNRCCRPARPDEACGPQDIWFCVFGDPCLIWIVGGVAGLIIFLFSLF